MFICIFIFIFTFAGDTGCFLLLLSPNKRVKIAAVCRGNPGTGCWTMRCPWQQQLSQLLNIYNDTT